MTITITLNGSSHYTPDATVAQLVTSLALNPTQIAIEKNRTIVPRTRWQEEALAEGDEVEVVRLIGGG